MISTIKDQSYEDHLRALGLTSLEDRRVRGDFIQMYKILNGLENIKLTRGVNYANSLCLNLRRSNDKKLVREINKRGVYRYNFLTNRVTDIYTIDRRG